MYKIEKGRRYLWRPMGRSSRIPGEPHTTTVVIALTRTFERAVSTESQVEYLAQIVLNRERDPAAIVTDDGSESRIIAYPLVSDGDCTHHRA